MPDAARRGIRFVLTDIDDTLSTRGKITGQTYRALERLTAAGKIVVIPSPGALPAGAIHIARMWPVDAVVGENGAFYMRVRQRRRAKLVRRFRAERRRSAAARRATLAAIGAEIVREVQGARARVRSASTRESDLAIDYCEDVCRRCGAPTSTAIVALMRSHGLTAKISSDPRQRLVRRVADKLAMTARCSARCMASISTAERERFVFARRFTERRADVRVFPYAVGVANVRAFLDRIEHAAGVRHSGADRATASPSWPDFLLVAL